MKRSKLGESEIPGVAKAVESVRTWGRSRVPQINASDLRRLRELEEENAKREGMYADVSR